MEENQRKKILVVDDAENVRHLLRVTFRGEPYDIIEAEDGLDALDKVKEHKPDLILLDIMLPGLSGLDVMRRLKAGPETRGIPVIMVTAKSGSWDMLHGHLAGADSYVTKPFDPEDLKAKVRMFLRLKDEQDYEINEAT